MPGGLLNIIAYGNQNTILNGNPKKILKNHFLKPHTKNIQILVYRNFELILTANENFECQKSLNLHFTCPDTQNFLWILTFVLHFPQYGAQFIPQKLKNINGLPTNSSG